MKKGHYYFTVLTICSAISLSGCGKTSNKNHSNSYHSTSQTTASSAIQPTQPLTTMAPENAPNVNLKNLIVTAGSEIDYMSAIESAENIDLKKSMISINSSAVDRFTPGTYTVYYTFDYMGSTTKSFILVTVLENTEETSSETETSTSEIVSTAPTETEPNSEPLSEISSSSTSESSAEQPSNQTTTTSSSISEESTASSNNSNPNSTIPYTGAPIPDAVFTLSTGETITIHNTPERYIVETFTDESYYTEDGVNFLQSELKILLNTGDVQTIEMVISQVSNIPETTSSE